MDLVEEVLKDLKGKKRPSAGIVVAVKPAGEGASLGARMLKAIKDEDAEAIDAILRESDEDAESEDE
jgi:hypothetical protein